MKINEVAKLSGITVRMLHYFEQIGLLHPSETTEVGYRIYNQDTDVPCMHFDFMWSCVRNVYLDNENVR